MAVIIRKAIEAYLYLNDDLQDPRTRGFYLLSNPLGIIAIITLYNALVLSVLPQWMKSRPAFNLKYLIVVYDMLQVIINSYMVMISISVIYWPGKYNIFCQKVDRGTSTEEITALYLAYAYFLVKIFDLLDTVFFVLTKKTSHVNFLHTYHHSAMILCGWIGSKYVPGGQSVFFGTINSIVHSFMYTYYLLAALKFLNSQNIFLKRCLTQLQMVQFVLIIIHNILPIVWDCSYPAFVSLMLVPQNVFMIFMFLDFYKKAYIVKSKKKPV